MSAESLDELRRALAGRSAHVAAKAAQIAGECELESVVPDLVAAFERFLDNPVKSDPQCVAKAAIVEALQRMAACEPGVYLRGIGHVQLEPVWGGRADSAAGLRGVSAFGLVADPEPRARVAAARAIGAREDESGIPLLRLKALVGDEDPEVVSECFSALLSLGGGESVEFVARFLDHAAEETRESAALALGSSRRAEALAVLRRSFEQSPGEPRRRTALLAISMLKRDEALEFLLALVAEAPGPTARLALEALALHRYDDALVVRVRAAAVRDDADLTAVLAKSFD
jgi:HEAT repeat protein